MKKILYCMVLILSIVFFATTAFSEGGNAEEANGLKEEQAYKMLYEDLKDANGKILDTVYYALAGLAGAAALIIGANTFFSYRTNTKEIEVIKKSLENDMEKFKNDFIKELEARIELETEKFIKYITLEQKNQMSIAKTEIELKYNSLENKFTLKQNNLQAKLNENSSELEKKITELKVELLLVKGDFWDSVNVGSIAIECYVESALLILESGHSVGSLDSAIRKIEARLKKTKSFYAGDRELLATLLDKLQHERKLQYEILYELQKNIPSL